MKQDPSMNTHDDDDHVHMYIYISLYICTYAMLYTHISQSIPTIHYDTSSHDLSRQYLPIKSP